MFRCVVTGRRVTSARCCRWHPSPRPLPALLSGGPYWTVTVVIEETCFRVLDGEVEISTHPLKNGPVTRYIADPR